jgi:arylsulfatase A-like enzyme
VRSAALAVVALAAGGLLLAAAPKPAPAARPNVILISIDTLRADRLGSYGHPRPTSPAIDALARESILFERAFSHSPKTASSHMSVFTSLYPSGHGVVNWEENGFRLSPDIPTLPGLLNRAGYRTAANTGGGNVAAELGFDEGFEAYSSHNARGQSLAVASFVLADLVKSSRSAGKPFFLFFHTYDVHDPYTPPAAFARLFVDPAYKGAILDDPEELRASAPRGGYDLLHPKYWASVDRKSPADLRHVSDLYDAGIREVDTALAGFFARFRELGLAANTVLVLISDHGEEFLEHGGFNHNSVYQEVLHVPLILRLPGAGFGGTRVGARVRLIDLMPTLLALAGLPSPPHAQGESLIPLYAGAGPKRDRFAFSEWRNGGQRALQTESWKYVERLGRDELYDLATDPGEKRSLAAAQGQPLYQAITRSDRLQSLSRELLASFDRGDKPRLDEATRRELQALGYLGP